jgi:hypothetical protein
MLKALVIFDNQHKFRDIGDVVAVARAEGQKLFKTHQNVRVVEIFKSLEDYYVVVVADSGCSVPLAEVAAVRE